jgi:hypothetical protein
VPNRSFILTVAGNKAWRLGSGLGFVTGGPYLLVRAVYRDAPVIPVALVRAETLELVEASSETIVDCSGRRGVRGFFW